MDLHQAEKLLVDLFMGGSNLTVELQSKPGVGKSSVVRQAVEICSERLGEPVGFRPFHLSTIEAVDAQGYMIPAKNKEGEHVSVFTRSPILPPKNAPKRGVLFLDERKQATQEVNKPIARLIEERQIGDQKLPEGWVVWCASNRVSDKSGAIRDMAFFRNRMCIIQVEAQLNAWVRWAETHNVHPFLIAFAKKAPGIVFDTDVPVDEAPFCTPRTLVKTQDILVHVNDTGIATEAVCGLVGEGAGAELMAFMRVANQLPDFEEIVKQPEKVMVPEAPDAQLAVTQMCAHRISTKNAVDVFKYLLRLPKEFQISALNTSLRKVPSLMSDEIFSKWLTDNSKLVLSAHGMS